MRRNIMSLSATLLEAATVRGAMKYGSFENRKGEYGALKAVSDFTNQLVPAKALEAVRTSTARTLKIPILQKYSPTLITERDCDFDTDNTTSAVVTPSWFTTGFTASLTPSAHENNYISQEEDLAHQMFTGVHAVMNDLDSRAVTYLAANKQATLPASVLFGAGTSSYTAPKNLFYLNAPAAMRKLKMSGPYQDVSNIENAATQLYMQSFGANNQQNMQGIATGSLPGAGQFNFYPTTNITPTSTFHETHYLFPQGSVGMLNWVDFESRNSLKVHDGKYWGTWTDPMFGFNWGIYVIKDCEDKSAEYGDEYTAVYTEKLRITADFSFIKAYSSDATSPIIKFDLSAIA